MKPFIDYTKHGYRNWRKENSLSSRVRYLEENHDQVLRLCGEMIGTLLVPHNQEVFELLPPSWHEIVDGWKKRWDSLTAGQAS
jgi:hypothetical protein